MGSPPALLAMCVITYLGCGSTHWGRDEGPPFRRRHFRTHFLNDNIWISNKITRKFVSKGPINNIPALVQIVAWRRPGDKPLFEPMMVRLLRLISVIQRQWDKQWGDQMKAGIQQCYQKWIGPGNARQGWGSHNVFTRQVWAQCDKQFISKFLET